MSFRSSTPFDFCQEQSFGPDQGQCYGDEFFDEFLNLEDNSLIEEASGLAIVPRSPQLATAPSPSQSQASGFESLPCPSHHASQADSDIGYWSNYSRPQSPVTSLRRIRSTSGRSVSSFRSARERSRERVIRRNARSASRSAIRKSSSPPKNSKMSSSTHYQMTSEQWTAKLAEHASALDFGFQTTSMPPISPPPSARVSDASSSENTSEMMRGKIAARQQRMLQVQQYQLQQSQQIEHWEQQNEQFSVVRSVHMPTPLTTPKYNEISIQQNNIASFTTQASEPWTTMELSDEMIGSFSTSFIIDGSEKQWWEEPEAISEQEGSPVELTQDESFPQPMAMSPSTSRNMNSKSLSITLPSTEQRPGWLPVIDTNVSTVDVDLTISPGVRPTPIALKNANHFGHGSTQSLPSNNDSMLLPPHVSVLPSPTKVAQLIGGAEPSPLRHQKSGLYFSNVAPPPVPAYLQSQQASPMMRRGSPMRHHKSRCHLERDDRSSPPSRSASPSLYSQSFENSLGNMNTRNASPPNFSTPHPQVHPHSLQVSKARALLHKQSEPIFVSHHPRGRSSQLYALGYPSLPASSSQSFPQPGTSPSPRQHSRARMHARSKSSSNLRHPSSSTSTSSKRSSSAKKQKGDAPVIEFHNFTPQDGSRILSGVAPSGSSKTKARREKEALEKRRRFSELAIQHVQELGGDAKQFRQLVGDDTSVEGSEMGQT